MQVKVVNNVMSFRVFFNRFVFCFAFIALIFSISLASTSICFASAEPSTNTPQSQPSKVIGISQIVEHPALDAVREGLLQELNREGYVPGKNLSVVYENAQGSVVTSAQIAKKLLSEKLDVAVAISTPSAQTLYFTALKQKNKVPIVFTAVSNPEAAKLVVKKERLYPITGISDAPNLEALFEVMEKMMPKLKILGILYNPSEPNSVDTVFKFRHMLEAKNIQVHEVTVSKTADVSQAMQSMIGKVDALYFPQDNTVVAAIDTVVGIASQSELPVFLPIFSSDPDLVKKGVVAGVGYDYTEVGIETGKVVGDILKGVKAENIPVRAPNHVKTIINKPLVEKYGMTVPTSLKFSELTFLK